ncbi:MAG: glycosyltransferase family 2 protein [Lachnospiraceae bacterium]|jgi:glycosyltransferase involved in cell wall biosynthesis|nr:glycosyltransferase family 2 protein [Lachnospiraceae bacterium]MDD6580783.1 glycosyltransferase family 2 protein [Lachnospiraceae bacterium]MDD7223667.1 glycosyltransferase family 2 protein [Lachnospiraceae bacterium]MDO4508548.1 glycosyltransferase family 2 protein [Lachnospiraceae bacterium]
MKDPKLSVILITYNHEKYIEKALDSVLSQVTDFPFEIVIGDDCSPDDTKNIIREYRDKYPDIIRIVHREKNTGRPTLNVYETTMKCRGDYLAYLEGDDYWTDSDKLQKQMDFLNEHPEYIACTHSHKMIDDNGNDITDPEILKISDMYKWSGEFTMDDFEKSGFWPGHYASVVSKNIYKNKKHDYTILYKSHDFVDDGQILLFLLMEGKIYRLDDEMSVWRYVKKAGGNSWTSRSMKRNIQKEDILMSMELMKWLEKEYSLRDYAKIKAKKDFETALYLYSSSPSKENWQTVREIFEYNIKHVVMEDKKVSLIPYCIKCVKDKFTKY